MDELNPVQEMTARPTERPAARTPPAPLDALRIFERLALDPNVSIEKLERLVALHERATARSAEEQFNAALAAAAAKIRSVAADADNSQTRSRYASYRALDAALRPIFTKFGFALSFNTADSPAADVVRVTCDVTHIAGGARTYRLDVPADTKGARGHDVMTRTHAVASAVTYGMRYLLKMIFNVAIGEDDDDGNRASRRPARAAVETATGELTESAGIEDALMISEAQSRRLFVLAKKAGWTTDALRVWLKTQCGLEHTRDIRRTQYDEVCAAIEAGPVGDGAGAPL